MKKLLIILMTISLINSCGTDTKNDSAETAKNPDKAKMITRLNQLMDLLENENYDEAKAYFLLPEGMSNDEIIDNLSKLISRNEISKRGINILKNEKFEFGTLKEIYGEKGIKMAERAKLDLEKCYGIQIKNLKHGRSSLEVMALWDGENFKFFRLDNIGKIPVNWEEVFENEDVEEIYE
jgi:hypothetical protein